jgi:hypothetical protein
VIFYKPRFQRCLFKRDFDTFGVFKIKLSKQISHQSGLLEKKVPSRNREKAVNVSNINKA